MTTPPRSPSTSPISPNREECRIAPQHHGQVCEFVYTNHRLETEARRATLLYLWWGHSAYHTGQQWFACMHDLRRGEERSFAMRDMREFRIAPHDAASQPPRTLP